MAFGKSKSKNTQKDNGVNMDKLKADNPKQEWGDVYGNATELLGGLSDTVMSPFMELIERGEETMAQNPMLQLIQDITGGGGGDDQTLDPYEARIQELMTNRGMSRDQAVANQAGAMAAGGDINDNGAITNNEWAQKLGGDFDNDGNVTNKEFAQWKEQNPDHQAAGGTKYSGLPGENGMFSGQAPPQQAQQGMNMQGMAAQQGQQPMGQPQAGVMPAPPMQQQQPPQAGMQRPANGMQLPPEAQAALAKWNQQGGSYV
jgi:hypothetical protein